MRFIERNATGIVLAATAVWWSVFVVMHVVQPDLDPLRAPGSAYVLGEHGVWMRASYLAIAATLLAAGFGAHSRLTTSRVAGIARIAFVLGAAGTLLAGAFPMDYPGPPQSLSGALHAAGGAITFLCWTVGTLLFTAAARRDPGWDRVSGVLMGLAVASVASVSLLIGSIIVLGFGGFAQRILLAVLTGWLIAVALHLRRSAEVPVESSIVRERFQSDAKS